MGADLGVVDSEERGGRLREAAPPRVSVTPLESALTEAGARDALFLSRSSKLVKRSFDVAVSSLALVLLAPVLTAIAIAIRLDSPGQVLFRQRRVGRDGRQFEMLKLRSMYEGAEARKLQLLHLNEAQDLFKIRDDPRVTRVGRVIRKWSLDELPQLINVIRGEMSLVGPRPLVVDEASRIEGAYRRRLGVRPGITGYWQVLGSWQVPIDEMVLLDYLYVSNWSLWNDLKILCRTVPVVLSRRGV